MKKLLFSIILITLVSFGLNALPQLPKYSPSSTLSSIPWKVVAENSTVTIESGYKDYNANNVNKRYLVLRLTNNTNQDITVTFTKKMWYNGKEVIPDDYEVTLTIPANSYVEGDVYDTDKSLLILSESLDGTITSKLTDYEIKIIN